ncbi:MAG: protease, partial [Bacteroidota bacterium]|nr:protease [Bacteroidota bacterium]
DKVHSLAYNVYKRFVQKAADSRKMSFDQLRALAKGRVWTGKDAFEHGLVDVLGDFRDCIKIAKKRMGVSEDTKVKLRIFPEKEDEFLAVLKLIGIKKYEDDESASVQTNRKTMADILGVKPEDFLTSWKALPEDIKEQLLYTMQLVELSKENKVITAMPMIIEPK